MGVKAWVVARRAARLRFLKEGQFKRKKMMKPDRKGQNTLVMVASD